MWFAAILAAMGASVAPGPLALTDYVAGQRTIEQAIATTAATFRQVSPDGNSVTMEDLAAITRIEDAYSRAEGVRQTLQTT